jgi:hypothetical protein
VQALVITALLVLSLYGSYHFDVFGFELTDGGSSDAPASVASSLIASQPQTYNSAPPTVTATPPSTATPEPTATAEPTATPEPEEVAEEEDTEIVALVSEDEEPEATPEREPSATSTPELPTPTPSPTAVPATATPVPPTVTPTMAVAIGVLVTPKTGAQAATPVATAASAARSSQTTATALLPAGGKVTPYWDGLAGNTLGCNGYGVYNPDDPTTAAVSDDVTDAPCGTRIELCNGAGKCLEVVRKDTCPGCAANHIDLSRKAFETLCGAVNDCTVTFRKK